MTMQTAAAATGFAFAPPPVSAVPVRGSRLAFPVRRLYCIGRNYAAHAVEMGHDPNREPPFFFQKNPDNLLFGADFPYPPMTCDVHHEIELLVALKAGGGNVPIADALELVYGYAVALDMTRRDLQAEMKTLGRPWEIGKAFESSAPCGEIVPATEIGHPDHGAIWLRINGELRQEGDLNQMIWKVPEMVAYLSQLFMLRPGDVIMSGTPAGVGPVHRGDRLRGHIDGVGELELTVV